jgi:hypothetical protein
LILFPKAFRPISPDTSITLNFFMENSILF